MPLCPKCGAQLRDTDRFCPSCGQPTTMPGTPVPPPLSPTHTAWPAPPRAGVGGCRTVALIVAVIVALAVVFVAGLLVVVFRLTGPAVDSAKAHLDMLSRGKIEEAYDSAAQAFKDATPLGAYKKFLETYPALTRVKDLSLNERSVNNQGASLNGTIATTDGAVLPIKIRLVREKDQWRILGIEVEPAGPSESSDATKPTK
jgi:hypothetical protein